MRTIRLNDLNLHDIGNLLQLTEVVYEGRGLRINIPIPGDGGVPVDNAEQVELRMTAEEWAVFLKQTDYLEVEVEQKGEDGTVLKAVLRKSQRQVEQGISWRVFKRDGYRCRYCGNDDVPLTVDHLVTWETGGPTIEANLVAACRRCNKERGKLDYASWLQTGYYRKAAQRLTEAQRQANITLAGTLAAIPRMKHIRNR